MELATIEFAGYRRLAKTSCNVDGHVVAFVGPNEAGKSSVLSALAWLTEQPARSLHAGERSRTAPPGEGTYVVRAYFRLNDEDIAAVEALKLDLSAKPSRLNLTEFRHSRKADGLLATGISTTLTRNPKPFETAATVVEKSLSLWAAAKPDLASIEGQEITDDDILQRLLECLEPSNLDWSQVRLERLTSLSTQLDDLIESMSSIELLPKAAARVLASLDDLPGPLAAAIQAAQADPEEAIRSALASRMPKFLFFSDDDRDLAENYDLADESIRNSPPPPPHRSFIYSKWPGLPRTTSGRCSPVKTTRGSGLRSDVSMRFSKNAWNPCGNSQD